MLYKHHEVIALLAVKRDQMTHLTRNRERGPHFLCFKPGEGKGDNDLYNEEDLVVLRKYFDLRKQLAEARAALLKHNRITGTT